MTKAFLAICCHSKPDPQTVECLIEALSNSTKDLSFGYAFQMEAMIDRSRAMVAMDFLRSDFDVLVFIDADIVFMQEDLVRLVHDAIDKQSIVCGPYARGTESGGIIAVSLREEDILLGPDGSLVEIRWGGIGFLAIPRNVLIELSKTLPLATANKGLKVYPFFLPFLQEINGELIYLSEDYAFCQRASDLGFKIWIDTRIRLGHNKIKMFVPGN